MKNIDIVTDLQNLKLKFPNPLEKTVTLENLSERKQEYEDVLENIKELKTVSLYDWIYVHTITGGQLMCFPKRVIFIPMIEYIQGNCKSYFKLEILFDTERHFFGTLKDAEKKLEQYKNGTERYPGGETLFNCLLNFWTDYLTDNLNIVSKAIELLEQEVPPKGVNQ